MNNKDFDRWLKDSLEDHASAIPVGGWKSLHSSRKKQKRRFFWWYAIAAMLVFGSGILATYFITLEETPAISETKAPSEEMVNVEREVESEVVPFDASTGSAQASASLAQDDLVEDESIKKVEDDKAVFITTSEVKPTKAQIQTIHKTPIQLENRPESLAGLSISSRSFSFHLHPDSLLGVMRIRKSWPSEMDMERAGKWRNRIHPDGMIGTHFYLEPAFSFAALRAEGNGNDSLHANYLSLVNGNQLRVWNYSFGMGLNHIYNRHFQFQLGLRYQFTNVKGMMDYFNPVIQNEFSNPQNVGNGIWMQNIKLKDNNYVVTPNLKSHQLMLPIGIQYTPRGYDGFYVGMQFLPSINLGTKGNWVDPITLEPVSYEEKRSQFRMSLEFNLGYSFYLAQQNFRFQYRFSPWYNALQPPSANMGGNAHGIALQWQMP